MTPPTTWEVDAKQALVNIAEKIATDAHKGQTRRDGSPYLNHPARIVLRLKDEPAEVRAAAWLHDVLEDSKLVADDLTELGISRPVVSAVVALTHMPQEPYEAYITQITENPIARKVKIADILDNLTDSPTNKQILKYAKALQKLVISPDSNRKIR